MHMGAGSEARGAAPGTSALDHITPSGHAEPRRQNVVVPCAGGLHESAVPVGERVDSGRWTDEERAALRLPVPPSR